MISHKKKFIFTAVPKTGTSSIERSLQKYSLRHPATEKHFTFLEYQKKYKNTKDYFSFAFVRNPFDRLVSQFHFTGCGWFKFWAKQFPHFSDFDCTFANFVRHIVANDLSFSCHRYQSKLWNRNRNNGGGPDSDFSMHNYVRDINFIGKFENLQEDFNIACEKIGIPQQQLPHKNETNHKHYTEYYDDETRQIVAEKYAKDIEFFGYKFEL